MGNAKEMRVAIMPRVSKSSLRGSEILFVKT